MYTLDLARAQIRQLNKAAERDYHRDTLPDTLSVLRRLTGHLSGNR